MTATFFKKQFIIFLIILFTFANNISCASILSTSNNTITISNITSTAVQSAINGDSFSEALKHQAINTIVMAGADYAANQIGEQYHTNGFSDNNVINKATQLTLHAGLGALANGLTGNDAMSGAVSGVVGEITGEYLKGKGYSKENGSELAGLSSGIFSLLVGKMENLDTQDISDNVFAGYRVGKNASENNAFFANKKKKAVVVVDDGDFNAYMVKDDVKRESIEKDPEKYKDNNILYTDIFIDGKNELSGKDLTLTEQLFNNQEVHNELLLLDGFDKKLSITDNATNLLMSGKLDVDTFFRLQNAVNNGADDFSLSYLFANNLWKEIADNTIGISYPTQKMMEAFNIKIEYRDVINPAVGQDNRTLANGTCASSGCGQYGAPRIGRDTEHQGTDYLILPDGYVLVVMDGAIYRTNSSKIPSRALPSYAIENKNTGMRSLVLYNNLDPSIKDNTKVQQGGVVGRPISQSEFDRVYNTVKDKKGNIIKTLKPGDKGYTVPHLHFERMRLDDWSNKSDTLPIVFPNKIPEKLPNKK